MMQYGFINNNGPGGQIASRYLNRMRDKSQGEVEFLATGLGNIEQADLMDNGILDNSIHANDPPPMREAMAIMENQDYLDDHQLNGSLFRNAWYRGNMWEMSEQAPIFDKLGTTFTPVGTVAQKYSAVAGAIMRFSANVESGGMPNLSSPGDVHITRNMIAQSLPLFAKDLDFLNRYGNALPPEIRQKAIAVRTIEYQSAQSMLVNFNSVAGLDGDPSNISMQDLDSVRFIS